MNDTRKSFAAEENPVVLSTNPTGAERDSQNGNLRRFVRQRIETLAYIGLGPGNGGVLIDVSEAGMAFQGIQPLEKDQQVCIKFKPPGSSISVESTAQIVWLNESGKGGGLRFIDLPEEMRSIIKELFSGETILPAALEKMAVRTPLASGGLLASATESFARAATSTVRNPPLLTDSSKAWIAPFARALLLSVGILAVLGAVLTLFGAKAQRPSAIEGEVKPDIHLGLRLDRGGPDWHVSWNRNADVLLQAVGGKLSITDGGNIKELDLDPGELKSGGIVYTPATADVIVRLRIIRGDSAQPISESVRAIAAFAPQLALRTKAATPPKMDTTKKSANSERPASSANVLIPLPAKASRAANLPISSFTPLLNQ